MTRDEAVTELGLPEDWNSETLKAHYRQLAQKHHPDKGGEEARFKKIKAAYELLAGKEGPDEETALMLERLASFFMTAVDGQSEEGNPLAAVEAGIRRVQKEMNAAIATSSGAIRKRERVLKRLRSRTPEATFLHELLNQDIAKQKSSIVFLEAELLKTDKMRCFLADYDYDEEPSFNNSSVRGLLGGYKYYD